MAEHAHIRGAALDGTTFQLRPSGPVHVAVPVDEYADLIRARDILADIEHLADDIARSVTQYHTVRAVVRAVVLDRLRGPAPDGEGVGLPAGRSGPSG